MAGREIPSEPIAFLDRRPEIAPSPQPSPPGERGNHRTPHERGRSGRKVTITLPDERWVAAVEGIAELNGLRPCDVWVYAVSYLMAGLAHDAAEPPRGEARGWMRAGEGLVNLPWEPGGGEVGN